MTLLVFDIGGTSVKYALFKDGELGEVSYFQTPKTWDALKVQIKSLKETYETEGIVGLAFSCLGVVDAKKGMIGGVSAVPYLHHFPIVRELEDLCQLPVAIENDANCAALAELSFGVARDVADSAFFIIGSGVGGALILDRSLRKGVDLFTGEFGLMSMMNGETLSQLVSPVHLAKRYQKEMKTPAITGEDIFRLAKTGDKLAGDLVSSFYETLSRAIVNVALVVNPELIVIGGAISKRDDLLTYLNQSIEQLKVGLHIEDLTCRLATCRYYNDANLLGAASNWLTQFGTMSKRDL
ncbi:ROK family protein [Streptococcus sp. zg-JUN1979]|uniref:ROK family protein n=1 Tax=Streptococcus sp. zg-JUN1979 TaxID=3391450 RepID=UPI0039A6CAB4